MKAEPKPGHFKSYLLFRSPGCSPDFSLNKEEMWQQLKRENDAIKNCSFRWHMFISRLASGKCQNLWRSKICCIMAFSFTLTVLKSNLKHSFLSKKKRNLLWLFLEEEYSSKVFCVLGIISYIQYEINGTKSLLLNKYLCWKNFEIFS